jgi:beta-1,4-mannosyltransferase
MSFKRGDDKLTVLARPAFRDREKKPYNALLYSTLTDLGVEVQEFEKKKILRGGAHLWHVHWPESLIEVRDPFSAWLTAREYCALFRVARRRGIKLIWTIHDLVPHDLVYPQIELPFWDHFVRRVDAVIALTRSGLEMARERYTCLRTVPSFVIPHGHLRQAYPRTVSRDEARRILGIPSSKSLITFFGQLRPYKNVPRLINAFRDLDDPDVHLLVCGRLSKRIDVRNEILMAAAGDPRVHLVLRYIEAKEIQIYLAAADLVVLPYAEILNSGSAMLGLSFDRPVLVPAIGALPELRRSVGDEWVRTYQEEIDTPTLRDALAWAESCPRGAEAPLDAFEWQAIGRKTLAAYNSIVRSEFGNNRHRRERH